MDGRIGSVVLLVAAALLVVRPWEHSQGPEDGPAQARARVLRAVDGDTLEVAFDGKREDVRLIGIDTPETVKPDTPVQCFGPRASAFTHGHLDGRHVRLVFGVERRDVYGRLLAYVYFRGRLFEDELVRRGLARTLAIAPNTRFASRFQHLQGAAARAGRGLWGGCNS
ncbi:MAG TPA: thermonuclease family protein [Solirubrobacterales bacterium]|nr:thermonuclease family protein [Solirubrobacterales bacterium]